MGEANNRAKRNVCYRAQPIVSKKTRSETRVRTGGATAGTHRA